MFDEAENVPANSYDAIVCLGDLVDDWGQTNNKELYSKTLDRVIEFGKEHQNFLLCWGNHDISYLYWLTESGFSWHMAEYLTDRMQELKECLGEKAQIIHKVDNWIFSHAGLTNSFIKRIQAKGKSIEEIIDITNKKFYKSNNVLNYLWKYNSPIWYRFQYPNMTMDMYSENDCFQCVGHSPTELPLKIGNALSVDTFSTRSNGEVIGNAKFVIIDAKTNTWEYAKP